MIKALGNIEELQTRLVELLEVFECLVGEVLLVEIARVNVPEPLLQHLHNPPPPSLEGFLEGHLPVLLISLGAGLSLP